MIRGLLAAIVMAGGTLAAGPAPDQWPVFRGNPQQTGVVAAALPDNL